MTVDYTGAQIYQQQMMNAYNTPSFITSHTHTFIPSPQSSSSAPLIYTHYPFEVIKGLLLSRLSEEERIRRDTLLAMNMSVCCCCNKVCDSEGGESWTEMCVSCSTILTEEHTKHLHNKLISQQTFLTTQPSYPHYVTSGSLTAQAVGIYPSTTTGTATTTCSDIISAMGALTV